MADRRKMLLRALIPLILGVIIVSIPPPSGLQMNAWLYFALFVAVITGVITEPIPAAAVGLIGVIVAAVALGLPEPFRCDKVGPWRFFK